MRRIITTTFVTLDGVMQAPGSPDEDQSSGFEYGGWQAPFTDDGEFIGEIMGQPFDLLLGRKTYEIFARYWPHNTNSPIGAAFDKATKFVASRSRPELPWNVSELLEGDVNERLRSLKQQGGPDLHVWGSSELIQTMLGSDVIDEMRILTYPIVLGQGKRLFADKVAA